MSAGTTIFQQSDGGSVDKSSGFAPTGTGVEPDRGLSISILTSALIAALGPLAIRTAPAPSTFGPDSTLNFDLGVFTIPSSRSGSLLNSV
ncbi:hypothetical protein EVAR_20757_1 [Eumeta japonica]|uniref:Uncharacterized protein n=1 Tax=Eumeta variegata TaxID=151549 RepID=A0A4C1VBQ7_EUMVA|nr:hypothetical protein EVAR_20757_1 [Eumeta japonica]